jgi:nicotinamidase-related amidase
MLKRDNTALIVIDVQGKLARLMHEKDALFQNLERLIKGAQILGIPILWTEQNPKGLGSTIPEIASLLSETTPLPKVSFSCCGDERFIQELQATGRTQFLISGIEAHICVYQTVRDLLSRNFEAEIVVDAVSSRNPANKEIGLEKMKSAGARMTSTETALYELLEVAKGDQFKEILKIVK